jgi:DNA-binding transcriptional LysR family regulator
MAEMGEARVSLQEMGRWGRGRIRVGASHSFCQYILPSILRKFRENFVKCFVTVEAGDSPAILDLLRTNQIDLALCLEPSNEEQFEFHPLFTDELFFLTHPTHPWAVGSRVHRDEIARQDYIFYNKTSLTCRAIEHYFQKENIVPHVVMHLGSMEAIKELVKAGLGLTIAPLWPVRREIEEKSITYLPLGKRKLRRAWGLCHWRGRRLTLPEESFLSLTRGLTAPYSSPEIPEVAA